MSNYTNDDLRRRRPSDRHAESNPLVMRITATVFILVAVTGCSGVNEWIHKGFKVGPDYGRPATLIADNWIDYENVDVASDAAASAEWWRVLGDPVLDELIATATQQNLTLQAAGMRILEARARLNIARGALLPQFQQAYGDYTRINLSTSLPNTLPVADFDLWGTGFNASWELDFWGRFRRGVEQRDALLNAEIESYDNALVILQAEVARAYIQYRTLQQQLELSRQNVTLQKRTLEIADVQHRNGKVTELDVAQAKENLAATESLIPGFESGIRQIANALCVLVGMPPHDLTAELGEGRIPTIPDQLLVGIPADLLRRRPDIRRAERLAAAQCAAIGVAETDLYPRIAITGLMGYSAESFSQLFDDQSVVGQIGPGFQWNILNYGRIRNNVRANDAKFQQLVYEYQNSVLVASREVEDAIVACMKERQRVNSLNESSTQATRAVEISTTQYRSGKINFQPVVYMQQIMAARQIELTIAQGTVAQQFVAIYKALGGGWQSRLGGGDLAQARPASTGPNRVNEAAPTPADVAAPMAPTSK